MIHPLRHREKMDFETLSPLFLPEESSKEFFFWGGGGNCFISNVLTKKTQIMFVSIHEKWHLAQQKLHLSFIKKALWNNARAGQDYPRASNNWKFYLWRWEENMYTIFC